MQQETVEDVLAAHGIGDLDFLVMLAQFGEIHDLVAAAEILFAIDLEHHFLGVGRQWHRLGPNSKSCASDFRLVVSRRRRYPRLGDRVRKRNDSLILLGRAARQWHPQPALIVRQLTFEFTGGLGFLQQVFAIALQEVVNRLDTNLDGASWLVFVEVLEGKVRRTGVLDDTLDHAVNRRVVPALEIAYFERDEIGMAGGELRRPNLLI